MVKSQSIKKEALAYDIPALVCVDDNTGVGDRNNINLLPPAQALSQRARHQDSCVGLHSPYDNRKQEAVNKC